MTARPAGPAIRLPDWPERLAEFIEARRYVPFAWGAQDCCLFAADAVQAMTGIDRAASLRGYTDEAGAEAQIIAAGGLAELVAATQAAAGAAEIAPAMAQRGDTVLLDTANMPAMGVVIGATVAAAGPDGISFYPLSAATRAWVT